MGKALDRDVLRQCRALAARRPVEQRRRPAARLLNAPGRSGAVVSTRTVPGTCMIVAPRRRAIIACRSGGQRMPQATSRTIVERVNEFVLETTPARIPADILHFASLLLLDTLGVAAAAHAMEPA